MTDERFYSPRPSSGRKSLNSRKSFVEMLEEKDRRNNPSSLNRNENRVENGTSIELVQNDSFTAEDVINRTGIGMFQTKLVLLSAFVWMAKGFDLVSMMFVSSLSTCEWKLSRWHAGLMFTITTIFTTLGCITYGVWSDKYGRRTALSSSLIFVFVFGAVSAGLPSYTWYLIFRTVTSFSIGGLPQALTLCCEYIPGKQRGRAVYILSCFWAVGIVALLGILFSVTGPEYNHWRLFAAVSALPAGIAMVMMRFFPESIRFLLVSDEYLSANTILNEMAKTNKMILPHGQLYPNADRRKRGRFCDLFSNNHVRSTLLFCFMGLATTISYYSLDAMIPIITQDQEDEIVHLNITTDNFLGDIFQSVPCLNNLTDHQFIKILWTNALDFPGYLIYILLVDVIDRKKLLSASCALSSLFIFLLYIQTSNITALSSFLFTARTLIVGQFDMLLLMTAEGFPTTLRGTAVGLESANFAVGSLISPYIVQSLLGTGLEYLIGFCGVIIFLSAIASACLTWETRGLELMETTRYD